MSTDAEILIFIKHTKISLIRNINEKQNQVKTLEAIKSGRVVDI